MARSKPIDLSLVPIETPSTPTEKEVMYWLQCDVKGDDVLPYKGSPLYKMSCSRALMRKQEITTLYPNCKHRFVTVSFKDIPQERRQVA